MREAIEFKLVFENNVYCISSYAGEYRSLMALIKHVLNLDCFGDCGGMARCGTCKVKTMTGQMDLNQNARSSEEMKQMAVKNEYSILSCQILIDHTLNGLFFEVLE